MEEEFSESEESGKSFREYLSALRRRKWQILGVAALLAPIAFVVAMALPAVYRSTSTILVQEQEVPPDLVRSTITSFADERIRVISQRVMTRAQLLALVDKYDLYRKLRGRVTEDEIVDRMRRDITLLPINADISDRSGGHRVNATIAFSISYDAPDPERAQKVVSELVSLYLNENIKVRQQSVAETTAFLAQEADRLAAQIQATEQKLAEFKRRNVGRMPDSSAVNVQLSERTESELQRVDREFSILQDRKLSLESQLALVKPTLGAAAGGAAATSPAGPSDDRMGSLQAQYARATAIYGADHPDVRRLQREIAALRSEGAAAGRVDAAEQRRKLEAELAAARDRYGEDHPDVQRLKRALAAVDTSDTRSPASQKDAERRVTEPQQRADNPAYILLLTQLEGVQREMRQLTALKDDLRAKQRAYDARLLQIPEVEREYRELTRDYDNAQGRYREIKAKQLQAEGAVELERELKAERFSLVEPANLPQKPYKPNRPQIALLGLLASLGSGLGLAFLREVFDSSVKGPLELARIANAPILTAIPYIETQRERQGMRRKTVLTLAVVALLVTAFILGVHFFVKPLPELLEAASRKLLVW